MNRDLCSSAQAWADHLLSIKKLQHSDTGNGENLYYSWSSAATQLKGRQATSNCFSGFFWSSVECFALIRRRSFWWQQSFLIREGEKQTIDKHACFWSGLVMVLCVLQETRRWRNGITRSRITVSTAQDLGQTQASAPCSHLKGAVPFHIFCPQNSLLH